MTTKRFGGVGQAGKNNKREQITKRKKKKGGKWKRLSFGVGTRDWKQVEVGQEQRKAALVPEKDILGQLQSVTSQCPDTYHLLVRVAQPWSRSRKTCSRLVRTK